MKFGINLLLWTADPTDAALDPLYAQLAALGYDGVELPIFDPDVARYEALGRRLDGFGLARTASSALMPDHDPSSPDPATRTRAVAKIRQTIDAAAAAGASLLVGPLYAGLGAFSGAPPTAVERARSAESVRAMADHAAGRGVTLALEFLNRFETYLLNTAADTRTFVDGIAHPSCRMMYDTFHAHIEEKDPASALSVCGPALAHVHLSENDRGTPGQGQVRWDATFQALQRQGYEGWLTIEAFGQALPAIVAATKVWRRFFLDELTLAREGLAFVKRGWAQASSSSPSNTSPAAS